jgi:F-type H+-transporting ATPase subunit a
MNPIHQFEIHELFPIAKIGKYEIAFTNSAAYMLLAVVLLTIFFLVATARWSLVPSRLQSAAELSYEFVGKMVQSTAGTEGMKFFPFVFTLFMFVLTLNMISLIPHTFSVTSQIIITAALALTVFFTVLTYGFIKNGFHFLNVFVP